MLIDEDKLKHWIENFYGYGSWQARIWFVAYEEGGGDVPEDVAEKINWFSKTHPGNGPALCDIRDLYRHVHLTLEGPKAGSFVNRYEYRFGDNAVQHGVWKNLIAFAHAYDSKEQPDLLAYQKKDLSLKSEALIQFYPLPSPHNHAWYYSWLHLPQLGFIKSRTLYEEYLYQRRIDTIITKIREHKPEIVLMYGMSNINTLKKSIQNSFPGVEFKLAKAAKLETPQYHRTNINGTTLLITTQIPALRHGRVETGFDWEKFGKQTRA